MARQDFSYLEGTSTAPQEPVAADIPMPEMEQAGKRDLDYLEQPPPAPPKEEPVHIPTFESTIKMPDMATDKQSFDYLEGGSGYKVTIPTKEADIPAWGMNARYEQGGSISQRLRYVNRHTAKYGEGEPRVGDPNYNKKLDKFMDTGYKTKYEAWQDGDMDSMRLNEIRDQDEVGDSRLARFFEFFSRSEAQTVAVEGTAVAALQGRIDWKDFASTLKNEFEMASKGETHIYSHGLLHSIDPQAFQMDDPVAIGTGAVFGMFNDWANLVPGTWPGKAYRGTKGVIGAIAKKSELVKSVGGAFSHQFGLDKDFIRISYLARKELEGAFRDVIEDAEHLAIQIPIEERHKLMGALINPSIARDWDSGSKGLLAELRGRMHRIGMKYVEEDYLKEHQLIENYWPRIMIEKTKTGYKFMDDPTAASAASPIRALGKPGQLKQRRFTKLKDAEKYLIDNKLPFGYSKDPIHGYAISALGQKKMLITQKYVDKAIEMFGTEVKNIKPGTLKFKALSGDKTGVFLPKGSLRFFKTQDMIPVDSVMKVMDALAAELKKFKMQETVTTTTTTTRTGGLDKASMSKPLQKMIQIVEDSLAGRGFSKGEIDNIMDRIATKGSGSPSEVVMEAQTKRQILHDKVAGMPGELIDLSKLDPTEAQSFIAVSKKVRVVQMPKGIADELNKMDSLKLNRGSKLARDVWDYCLQMFKGWATAANPGFHPRNMYSNWYLMWLGGTDLEKLPQLLNDARMVQQGKDGWIKLDDGSRMALREVTALANKLGQRGSGWIGSDMTKNWMQELNRTTGNPMKIKAQYNPLSREFFWLVQGRKVGTAVEDNARIALFIDGLKKGKSPEDAALHAIKYLFDYGESAPFERDVLRRMIPFYQWLRKNIPLQYESLMENPHKFLKLSKADRYLRDAAPLTDAEKANMPHYVEKLGMFKTPFKSWSEKNPLFWNPNLPFQDINKEFTLRELVTISAPLIKVFAEIWPTGVEFGTGTAAFSGKQIKKFDGDRDPLPVNWQWLASDHAPESFRQIMNIGPVTDYRTGEDVPGMDAVYLHVLRNMAPFFENAGKMAVPFGESTSPSAKDKYPYNVLSYLAGIKLMPLDTAMQETINFFKNEKRLRAMENLYMQSDEEPEMNVLKQLYPRFFSGDD